MKRIFTIAVLLFLVVGTAQAQELASDAANWALSQSPNKGDVYQSSRFDGKFALSAARIAVNETKIGDNTNALVASIVERMVLSASTEVSHAKTENSLRGGVRAFYQQYYNGFPVFDHGITIKAFQFPTGKPESISEDGDWAFYPWESVDFESTPFTVDGINSKISTAVSILNEPRISQAAASQFLPELFAGIIGVQSELGLEGRQDTGYRWAYRFTAKGFGKAEYTATIDASTGSVLTTSGIRAGINDNMHIGRASGSLATVMDPLQTTCTTLKFGDVFPNAHGIDSVTTPSRKGLTHVCAAIDDKYILDGKFVEILDGGGSEVEVGLTEDFDFSYPSADFDEVQAYYHATQFNQWMETNFQSYGTYTDYTMPFVTFTVNGSGSPHITPSSELIESEHQHSGSSTYWMYEGAIIAHEMYHVHEEQLNTGLVGGTNPGVIREKIVIGEALADFWGLYTVKN